MAIDLVTGAAGFLGRNLVASLLADGHDVVAVDDLSTPGSVWPDGVRGQRADLVRWPFTGGGEPIARIWHLACPASPRVYKTRQRETLRLGGHVLDNLLGLAADHGAQLLFASSSEVYGDPEHDRQQEEQPTRVHPTGPRGCYDLSKAYGEALCAAWHREAGVDARIVRIFNTFGPHMGAGDGRLVSSLIYAALTGTPFMVHGDGCQTRTLGFVTDTIAGLRLVMDRGSPAVPVNVGGETTVSVIGLAQLIQHEIGKFPLLFGPPQDEHDPKRRRPDLIRLRSLGWSPTVSLLDGIHLTAAWMRSELSTSPTPPRGI